MVNILGKTFSDADADELRELADDILKFNGYKKPKEHKDWRKKTMYEMEYKSLRNDILITLENIEWLHGMNNKASILTYRYIVFKQAGD